MRRTGLLALAGLLVLSGCALPLPHGVKTPGAVQGNAQQQSEMSVIPPGPIGGQDPLAVVEGFLAAQASSDGHRAIAREFLTREQSASWNDAAGVIVYSPRGNVLTAVPPTGTSDTVSVTFHPVAEVTPDGQYVPSPQTANAVRTVTYGLTLVDRQWRISSVPDGLALTAADFGRTFAPSDVYYLAPQAASAGVAAQPHLVPDRVWLPVSGNLPTQLVTRLLQAPSQALGDSVITGLPSTRLAVRAVSAGSNGVISVDLAGSLAAYSADQKQNLAARLVWTLRQVGPDFRSLLLLDAGKPVSVLGVDNPEDAGSWDSYDPDGLAADPPYAYVVGNQVAFSGGQDSDRTNAANGAPTATGNDGLPVAEVAVSSDQSEIALLAPASKKGLVTVRIGPLAGKHPTTYTGTRLTSPSWGSAAYGVWLVENGSRIVRVVSGASGPTRGQPVAVLGQPPGMITSLAVSRDGARAALVIGGVAYIARVEVMAGIPRLVDVSVLDPGLAAVTGTAVQAVWSASTELVVLGTSPVLARIQVDGTMRTPILTVDRSQHVAAVGGSVIVQVKGSLKRPGQAQGAGQPGTFPVFPG